MTHPDPLLERAKQVLGDLIPVVAALGLAESLEVRDAIDLLHDLREYLLLKKLAAQ